MANAVTTQILQDGPRNKIIKVVGILDTSDYSATAIADPTAGQFPCSQFSIERIVYTIEENLEARLTWDATTPVLIVDLVKAGHQEFCKEGGLQNNAGAGKTGKIMLATEGWSSGKIYSFTLVLDLKKQY